MRLTTLDDTGRRVYRLPMRYPTDDLRQIFEPLGFTVTEEDDSIGKHSVIRKRLEFLATRFDWPARGRARDLPLWMEVWSGGPIPGDGGERDSTVGVTGIERPGMGFTGQVFKVQAFPRLREVAPAICAHIEANVGTFVCPKCYGLLTQRSSQHGEFFGCQFFRHPHIPCDGKQRGPYERSW